MVDVVGKDKDARTDPLMYQGKSTIYVMKLLSNSQGQASEFESNEQKDNTS